MESDDEERFEVFRASWEAADAEFREGLPPELQKMLDRPMYFDPDGKPLDLPAWSELMWKRSQEIKQLGYIPKESWWCRKTVIGDVEVSTVWLGLDHNYIGGVSLTWETMIFSVPRHSHERWGDFQRRYHTRAAAFDGHEEIVRALRAGRDPND